MNIRKYELTILDNVVRVVVDVDNRCGSIESGLPRETCPSCDEADCANMCDGAQGADDENTESEYEAIDRQRYNAALNALESIVLAHACAGIDIENFAYVSGLEASLNRFQSNVR